MIEPLQIVPANPRASFLAHKVEIHDAIDRVISSGHYILGEEVAAFEKEFAAYIGVRYGIGVGSGTEALHLALLACGIGQKDEVITVSHTAVATVAAIELCGAQPVLVDIDPSSFTINPAQIRRAITAKTKAIIPVHLYGLPADMPTIMDIAHRFHLRVIEDCAQSHGASLHSRKTGAWGDLATFSFYPTKNLGALGDGGIVVTNDLDLAERVRLLREYGWRQRYISEVSGMNSRLDELQAAVLRVKLRYLQDDNARRIQLALEYDRLLQPIGVQVPKSRSEAYHVYHLYVIRHAQRDSLQHFLRKRSIGTLIHYPVPVHLQPAYRQRINCCGVLNESERAAAEVLSLPFYAELPVEKIEQVAVAIRDFR